MAQILSVAMMLRLSFGMTKEAALVEQACVNALAAGARTPDLGGSHSTAQVGDAVVAQLERLISAPNSVA
jgi:3-isopropylmalate dehydrogenase